MRTDLELPRFITKQPNNVRYAFELKRWISMITVYAVDVNRMKALFKEFWYDVYKSHDENAKDCYGQAESNGLLHLRKGDANDSDGAQLVHQIIRIVAYESTIDRVAHHVKLIDVVHCWKGNSAGILAEFSEKFKSLINTPFTLAWSTTRRVDDS